MSSTLGHALAEVRLEAGTVSPVEPFSLAGFLADARDAAALYASGGDCAFVVDDVDPAIRVEGDRELLLAALINLLHNAFKFTRAGTSVNLKAHVDGERVLVNVADHCGGLPAGAAASMFKPFTQAGRNRHGLGLGLSIARKGVEASGGRLTVCDIPGTGCIFTMDLVRSDLV